MAQGTFGSRAPTAGLDKPWTAVQPGTWPNGWRPTAPTPRSGLRVGRPTIGMPWGLHRPRGSQGASNDIHGARMDLPQRRQRDVFGRHGLAGRPTWIGVWRRHRGVLHAVDHPRRRRALGSPAVRLASRTALEGEAAFAASNGNLACHGDTVWIFTGGLTSRCLRSLDAGASWTSIDLPVTQGSSMTGVFSATFQNARQGWAMGGNWEVPEDNEGNLAVTDRWRHDLGRWQMDKARDTGRPSCTTPPKLGPWWPPDSTAWT